MKNSFVEIKTLSDNKRDVLLQIEKQKMFLKMKIKKQIQEFWKNHYLIKEKKKYELFATHVHFISDDDFDHSDESITIISKFCCVDEKLTQREKDLINQHKCGNLIELLHPPHGDTKLIFVKGIEFYFDNLIKVSLDPFLGFDHNAIVPVTR